MEDMNNTQDLYEGLFHDPESGDYRVKPGYGYQAHRYRIDDTWLDEDDNLWIKGDAVDREARKATENDGRS